MSDAVAVALKKIHEVAWLLVQLLVNLKGDIPPTFMDRVMNDLKKAKTRVEIFNHLNSPGAVQWIVLKQLFKDFFQSCVDGRGLQAVIGTPGGDMGLIVTILSVAEKIRGRIFSRDEVDQIFASYCKTFGKFYMHTDQHGLEKLQKLVAKEKLFADKKVSEMSIDEFEALVRKANKAQQEVLLKHLIKPETMGCGHLRLALQNALQYGVREELIEALVVSFYTTLWNSPEKVEWVVLRGGHAEKLVLVVHVKNPDQMTAETLVPAVVPLNVAGSTGEAVDEFFIYHPEVIAAIVQAVAVTCVTEGIIPGLTSLHINAFLNGVQQMNGDQLGATLGHLAPDLELWHAELEHSEAAQNNTLVNNIEDFWPVAA